MGHTHSVQVSKRVIPQNNLNLFLFILLIIDFQDGTIVQESTEVTVVCKCILRI